MRRHIAGSLLAAVLVVTNGCSNATAPEGSTTSEGAAIGSAGDETPSPAKQQAREMFRRGDVGPAGGYIFYVSRVPFRCGEDLSELCHHLEAAPYGDEADRSWSVEAAPPLSGSAAAGTGIGAGHANAAKIVSRGTADPSTSAVAYADAYEHNGFTDWYLPSLDEAHEMTIARELIGGFTFGVYWTSTERDAGRAWYQHFMNSFQFPEPKATVYRVRPIRAF